MELIINVPDKDAERVQAFLDEVAKPVKPNKGIPSITVTAENGGKVAELNIRGLDITARGMPESPPVKVGDVVERKADGAWGRVISTDHKPGRPLLIQASKDTVAELGIHKFRATFNEVEVLI